MAGTLGNKCLAYLKKKTNIAALLEETNMDFYPASGKTPSGEMRISLLVFLETLRALSVGDTVDEIEPKAFSLEQTRVTVYHPCSSFFKKKIVFSQFVRYFKEKNNNI